MRRLALPVAGALLLATTACSGMGSTEQRVLSGGTIGAGVGAAGTFLTGGCIACGAAIGGAVGAGAGWLLDEHEKGSF
jgi:osmotically inducible lipoprotein OsmB